MKLRGLLMVLSYGLPLHANLDSEVEIIAEGRTGGFSPADIVVSPAGKIFFCADSDYVNEIRRGDYDQ